MNTIEIVHNYLQEHHPTLNPQICDGKLARGWGLDQTAIINNNHKCIKIWTETDNQEDDTKIELHAYSNFSGFFLYSHHLTTIDIKEPNSLRTLSTHINIELL